MRARLRFHVDIRSSTVTTTISTIPIPIATTTACIASSIIVTSALLMIGCVHRAIGFRTIIKEIILLENVILRIKILHDDAL